MRRFLLLLIGVCATLLAGANAQSIIAVDPGTNFMKVALVQPGKVFDIALSPDSKRKTYTGLAIVDGVRSFGSESFNVYGKKPQNTVWRVRDMVGRSPNDPELLKTLKKHHLTQQQLLEASDGTGGIRIEFAKNTKDANIYSPEELFAMILSHCKENGERHGITKVNAVSLTVPAFFNQARRQGLIDSVEISGLSLLGLVDENGAAAVHYALERSFNDTPTNVLFFNMGASSTQVSIVQITGGKEKRSGKEFRNIKVVAKAWDEDLGAEDFDLHLAELFAKEFDAKHPSPDSKIMESPRAIVRLKKEARAIKEILSGLDKFPVSFQSLHRDIDFRSHVTRAQMEELAQGVLKRITAPVERALKAASMTIKDIHLVEMIGGGFRIPSVRDSLRAVIPPEMDLSTHVNSDEGMAFGTAFCAANVSSTFHVPRLASFQDAIPREVRLQLKGEDLERDVLLFPRFALGEGKEPVKHVIKFRHDKDFKVVLVEKKATEDDPAEYPETMPILDADVTGMKGAMEAFGKFGEPKVYLTFTLDRNLMVNLASAEARFDEEYEEVVKANTTAKASNNDSAADAATDAAKTEEGPPTTVKKTRKHLFQLTIKRTDESLPVKKMTAEAKAKAQEILKLMDEADKNRARREEARNSLEAYSFVSREKLDTNEADVKLVMSPEALEDVIRELRQVEDWIDDHRDASADDYIQERARLASKVDKIFHLIREHQERPAAVKAFRSLIRSLEDRRANWTTERPWIPEKVWEIVDKAQADALKWADDMEAKQAKLTPKEEPVLSLSSIRAEMEKIQKMVELLLKQRRPPPTNTGAAKKKATSGEDKKDGANNNKTEEASSEDYTNTASGEGYASSNQQESGGGEEQQQQSQQEGDSDEKKTNEEEKKDATPEKEEL